MPAMRKDYTPRISPKAYPIDPKCPAPRHNTRNAALGLKGNGARGRTETGFRKCICERAQELLAEFKANRRRQYGERIESGTGSVVAARDARTARQELLGAAVAAMPPRSVPAPDFTDAACRTPAGVVAMDDYVDAPQTEKSRLAAQAVCAGCRLAEACEQWILDDERPAGSWGGIYASMTPRARVERIIGEHRRRLAEQQLTAEPAA